MGTVRVHVRRTPVSGVNPPPTTTTTITITHRMLTLPPALDACGHKIIARILINLEGSAAAGSILLCTPVEVHASMQRVVGQFFAPRYTRAIHALRTNGRSMPDSVFEELFRQSYFDGHLKDKFQVPTRDS